ncbi:MAG: hypothetical protein WD800_03455, partial [Dehalococcoidia bacterium]
MFAGVIRIVQAALLAAPLLLALGAGLAHAQSTPSDASDAPISGDERLKDSFGEPTDAPLDLPAISGYGPATPSGQLALQGGKIT